MLETGASAHQVVEEVVEPSDLSGGQKEELLLYTLLRAEERPRRAAPVSEGKRGVAPSRRAR
jgi:hypothetical protein